MFVVFVVFVVLFEFIGFIVLLIAVGIESSTRFHFIKPMNPIPLSSLSAGMPAVSSQLSATLEPYYL